MRNILSRLKLFKALQAIVMNNTTEGTGVGVDRKANNLISLAFLFLVGISGDTLSGSVKFQPALEESSDSTNGSDGNWTPVDATDVTYDTTSLVDDPAEDDVLQAIEYIGDAQWVRPKVTVTGTHSNGTPISCVAVGESRLDQ